MLVKVIEEIFCQTTAVEEETVLIHTFLNAPCNSNGSPERLRDLQGLGGNVCVSVYVCTQIHTCTNTHTYIHNIPVSTKQIVSPRGLIPFQL